MKKVAFLDRDGTLIVEPPDEKIDSLEKLEFLPGVFQGLRKLQDTGYELVMVTNQDYLGTPSFPTEAFEIPHQKILTLLGAEGIRFTEIFICPHTEADKCDCRKPKTGLLTEYLRKNHIDLARSFVVGDRETDVQLARNIGCKAVRLTNGKTSEADFVTPKFLDACGFILRTNRSASVKRKTTETDITIDIVLDGSGAYRIATGIGFFDHMLELLSKHSLIDMAVTVKGDLRVDEHHTVEDTGLVLGEAIRQALGDKRGIERYGFLLPMDESLAQVALDLSGRPYFTFEGKFEREKVGELPTELVEDFFRALADGLRSNLHISVQGRNDHHKVEAVFKSVARALKQAAAPDNRAPGQLPSTKGIL
ncbi:MAG: bifunctional histidinol-phosphatase/imidazoleglycerol-phosphate dehydratase HisB [Ignavibacteriae bacterium]|nr:bifunctional histidinol-phosphatase/imidazoleglycerol-phosphate dehydratase HisB [Ignavibacteriota bacterium]